MYNGASALFVNQYSETPLFLAAKNGHVEAIHALVSIAQREIMSLCLEEGTASRYRNRIYEERMDNLTHANENGESPMHIAAINGHDKAISALAGYSDCLYFTKDGETPLYLAAKMGHVNAIQALVNSGAHVDCGIKRSTPPWEVEEGLTVFYENYGDKETPMYIAAKNGHVDAIRALVRCGADVNAARQDGGTPMHAAAQNGHVNAIEILAENRADINIANEDGVTPLVLAAEMGHEDAVDFLVEKGADINRALLAAAKEEDIQDYEHAIDILAQKGASLNVALLAAAKDGSEAAIRVLVQYGAAVNTCNIKGAAPLDLAYQNSHKDAIRALEDLGAQYKQSYCSIS